MSKRFIEVIILILLSSGIFAQSPTKILSQANKALGGEKNMQRVTSKQMKGRITRVRDGVTGAYKASTAIPNFYGEIYDLNGYEIASGYNGKSAWMRDSKNGLRTLTGEASQAFQAEAAYRNTRWLNGKVEVLKIVAEGNSNLNGKPAQVVSLTNPKGVQIKLLFEVGTGLLLREVIPQGMTSKIIEYSNYRAVDGVLEPFKIFVTEGEERYEIKVDDVQHNQSIGKANFDFPKVGNDSLPDIKTLLDEVRANADKVDLILENYSYTETDTEREVDKNGKLIDKGSSTTVLSFYKGKRITRIIAKDGKPLNEKDQAAEDRKVQKQIEAIEKGVNEGKPPTSDNDNMTIADLLRTSILVNPRRERFRDQEVIVFDFEPNPNATKKSINDEIFAMCTGAVWVDDKLRQVVRVDAYLTKSVGNFALKIKQGGAFSLENELVNNEIYLPAKGDFNIGVRILLANLKFSSMVRSGDYQKFKSEAGDYKITDPTKPK